MEKFVINTENKKMSSINRTIRIRPESFDKLMNMCEKTGLSFNNLVGQCIDYALNNMEEQPE